MDGNGGKVAKEPWDSSSEKGRTLKTEDFGTLEEVTEIARPIRTAGNRYEAAAILKEIAARGLDDFLLVPRAYLNL